MIHGYQLKFKWGDFEIIYLPTVFPNNFKLTRNHDSSESVNSAYRIGIVHLHTGYNLT